MKWADNARNGFASEVASCILFLRHATADYARITVAAVAS